MVIFTHADLHGIPANVINGHHGSTGISERDLLGLLAGIAGECPFYLGVGFIVLAGESAAREREDGYTAFGTRQTEVKLAVHHLQLPCPLKLLQVTSRITSHDQAADYASQHKRAFHASALPEVRSSKSLQVVLLWPRGWTSPCKAGKRLECVLPLSCEALFSPDSADRASLRRANGVAPTDNPLP